MTPGDYALALSLFFVSYNLCECVHAIYTKFLSDTVYRVPANLMLKKLSPKVWLSTIVFLFGVVVSIHASTLDHC